MKHYIALNATQLDETSKYLLMDAMEAAGSIGAEETEDAVIIYFNAGDWDESIPDTVKQYTAHFDLKEIAEENWNATWESNFDPVLIDDFCYIRAHFHPERSGFEHVIHITPKMSFGTGHHATTFQVIQMMRKLSWQGKNVLDFGTGTGILAILAEKLGADAVLAIDNDPWSADNATENGDINQTVKIRWQLSSIDAVPEQAFDIIIANINRHILLENMTDMAALLVENGHIIMSGILEEDYDMILESASANNLHLKERTQKNKWLCLLFVKR